MSSRRKGLAIWSIVLAVVATLGTAVVFTGALDASVNTPAAEEAVGLLIFAMCVIPSLVGLGIGLSARDRRLNNPPLTWVGWIWNAVLTGLWLLLMIVGMMMP